MLFPLCEFLAVEKKPLFYFFGAAVFFLGGGDVSGCVTPCIWIWHTQHLGAHEAIFAGIWVETTPPCSDWLVFFQQKMLTIPVRNAWNWHIFHDSLYQYYTLGSTHMASWKIPLFWMGTSWQKVHELQLAMLGVKHPLKTCVRFEKCAKLSGTSPRWISLFGRCWTWYLGKLARDRKHEFWAPNDGEK